MNRPKLSLFFALLLAPLVAISSAGQAEEDAPRHRIIDSFSGCSHMVPANATERDYLLIGECDADGEMSIGVTISSPFINEFIAEYTDGENSSALVYFPMAFIYVEGPSEMLENAAIRRKLEMYSSPNSAPTPPSICTETVYVNGETQETDCKTSWPRSESVYAALDLDRRVWTGLPPSLILAAAEEALRRGWYVNSMVLLYKLMEAHPAADEIARALSMREALKTIEPPIPPRYAANYIDTMRETRFWNGIGKLPK